MKIQFSFKYLFSFLGCYLFQLNCTINLQLIPLDFAIDFAIFGGLEGPTDEQSNGWMNQWMDNVTLLNR